jgi:hypothetical protein
MKLFGDERYWKYVEGKKGSQMNRAVTAQYWFTFERWEQSVKQYIPAIEAFPSGHWARYGRLADLEIGLTGRAVFEDDDEPRSAIVFGA